MVLLTWQAKTVIFLMVKTLKFQDTYGDAYVLKEENGKKEEKRIQDAMVNLMKNRTSLIIAHRISTIQDADCIVVMDAGHIAEMGNHEELLARKGKYYELYMTQFAGNAT